MNQGDDRLTSFKSSAIAKETDRYLIPTYERFPLHFTRGEGCMVFDEQGEGYLDFYGGHAVALLGHSPPEVVQAVTEQAKALLFYSNVAYLPMQVQAARSLVEFCNRPGAKVFFCNSGAEANENAAKIAFKATGKKEIVATVGSFHGRTALALAMTGAAHYRGDGTGLPSNVRHIPFGDLAAAQKEINPSTAAVIVEPIQSIAGVICPPEGYFSSLAEHCRKVGALLIFDELQTGLGRIGSPTAAHAFHVRPQLQTFAKGLGSGIPVGAVVADPEIAAKIHPGDLGTTFGGGPLACAATQATLQSIQNKRLWENAKKIESIVRQRFQFPRLKAIRGKGLLLGLEFDCQARLIRDALLQKKILVGTSGDPHVLRLMPPLTIGETEVECLHEALEKTFAEMD